MLGKHHLKRQNLPSNNSKSCLIYMFVCLFIYFFRITPEQVVETFCIQRLHITYIFNDFFKILFSEVTWKVKANDRAYHHLPEFQKKTFLCFKKSKYSVSSLLFNWLVYRCVLLFLLILVKTKPRAYRAEQWLAHHGQRAGQIHVLHAVTVQQFNMRKICQITQQSTDLFPSF